MNSGLEAIRKRGTWWTRGYSQWNNYFLFFPLFLDRCIPFRVTGKMLESIWAKAGNLNESLQGLMSAFGFNTLLKGTLVVPWHFPIIPEHLLSFARTGAWTENLLPSPVQTELPPPSVWYLFFFFFFHSSCFTISCSRFTKLTFWPI